MPDPAHEEITCPGCSGRWLDGHRYQHVEPCEVRRSLDDTQAADHERLRGGSFMRPATWAEQALAVAHGRADYAPHGTDPVALEELHAVVHAHPHGRCVVLQHAAGLLPEHDPDDVNHDADNNPERTTS